MTLTHDPPTEEQEPVFDELARRLRPRLTAYVARRVPAHAADDVVQETLLSLWRQDARATRAGDALAFRIADRRIADHFRDAARHDRRKAAARAEHAPHVAASDADDGPPAWLDGLSAEALEVLLLVVDGFSVAEIAERLDLTPGAVSSRLSRIRARVPRLIGDSDD